MDRLFSYSDGKLNGVGNKNGLEEMSGSKIVLKRIETLQEEDCVAFQQQTRLTNIYIVTITYFRFLAYSIWF